MPDKHPFDAVFATSAAVVLDHIHACWRSLDAAGSTVSSAAVAHHGDELAFLHFMDPTIFSLWQALADAGMVIVAPKRPAAASPSRRGRAPTGWRLGDHPKSRAAAAAISG